VPDTGREKKPGELVHSLGTAVRIQHAVEIMDRAARKYQRVRLAVPDDHFPAAFAEALQVGIIRPDNVIVVSARRSFMRSTQLAAEKARSGRTSISAIKVNAKAIGKTPFEIAVVYAGLPSD
jgi:hypothetical protein